jgi:glycosyltransferase involved in cell wall biosynthesis
MTTDTVGGVWTYTLEMVRGLSEQGIQVVLATMGPLPDEQQRTDIGQFPNVELHESEYKLEWMEDPWDDVAKAGEWLLELESRTRPELIHLNGYVHGRLSWRAPKLIVGHSCVLSWWQAVLDEPASTNWARYAEEVGRGLQAADLVVSPTAAMLGFLEAHYGPFRKRQVIPNGRSQSLFYAGKKENLVFSAGRAWDKAKNLAALDAAAAEIDWPAFVAGEPECPTGERAHFSRLRALGRLPQSEMAAWLARAAIYAAPARYEPFGLAILEAALAGCALVLGDIPSLREIWGETALYVPSADSAQLAETIQFLIHDEVFRADLALRSRARARQFTVERMLQDYLMAYRVLLRSKKSSSIGVRVA